MTEATAPLLKEEELVALASRAFEAQGVAPDRARVTAQILALGDMMGIHTHGLLRVVNYCERMSLGGIDAAAEPEIETLAPALARVDGHAGLGPVTGITALELTMEAARKTGIAATFCKGSSHFGAIAPYSLLAAEQGFASIIATNASVTIAPTGGAEARLGNNPIGFGFPDPGGDPVLIDMAISVAARGKIRAALKEGKSIPEDWATDRDGRPTSDPAEALKGFLQPMGGHKGYGLSLAVDMLCGVLSGATYLTHVSSWVDHPEAEQKIGHVFILIDTGKLGSTDWLAKRMRDATSLLRETPASDPSRPVMVPGDRELARLRAARTEGVRLDASLVEEIRALGGGA
ncbi:Ldh family oxidoreductase [Tropicimonas sp. IMCC34011]|uniref:Ldh family oxidoreductase n=1 Tax=Tropicimonas sp. IMCC34011 TaxID=2248759 RepID=UPI000E24EAFA|nr:Ldh family oxidoreductase [Tropicimonas sp. IMCC34011]